MFKKICINLISVFIIIGLSAAVLNTNSYADGTHNRYIKLKKLVINSYLKEIPLRFKNYFHFSHFRFRVQFQDAPGYSMVPIIHSPGFAGYDTAVIKLTNKKNGSLKGIAYATFKVSIYAPVVVASRTIGKFQTIKPEDVLIAYANIPNIHAGYYLNKTDVTGKEAKFTIVQNSVLSKINTERKRIINFGNTVSIVYEENGLSLKTKGTALQSGSYNSVIRVKNIESGLIVNGIVKSNKMVLVK